MLRILPVVLLLAACAADPLPGPQGPAGEKGEKGDAIIGPQGPTGLQGGSTVKSGTRLRAIVERSDDGASRWVGWWDSEFDEECKPELVGDRYLCVPVSVPGGPAYLDHCADGPYVYVKAGEKVPVLARSVALLGGMSEFAEVGEFVRELDEGLEIKVLALGTCDAGIRPAGESEDGSRLFHIGRAVSADRLVEIERVVE